MGNYHCIPEELRARKQFVVWTYEARPGQKSTKVPYNPITGHRASVSNPDTWASFDEAMMYAHCYDGIGYVLSKDDPYTFIDLDWTDDPDEIEFQKQIFNEIPTYAEISPSGKGLHLICRGKVPTGVRVGSVEVYSDSRYMAMTGDVYERSEIVDVNGTLDSLWAHLRKKSGNSSVPRKQFSLESQGEPTKDDKEVFEQASNASNGAKFLRLWNGDFHTDYGGDQSRADFALIDLLSFYSENAEQVKRMFRQSGLGQRDKAKRDDYVDKMIERSFDNKGLTEIDFSAIEAQARALNADIAVERKYSQNENLILGNTNEETRIPSVLISSIPQTTDSGVYSVPPGIVGEMAKFFYDAAYKPVPEIAIAGALAFMAGICGRAYNVNSTGLNLYMLLLAETGRGKEAINSGISRLLVHTLGQAPTLGDFIGPERFSSGQALLKTIANHPTRSFLSIFGEFGIQLRCLALSRSAHDQHFLRALLHLYNKSGKSDVLMPGHTADASLNVPAIHSPAFSFIGESTPSTFYESINEQMISSGLLPRFVVVEYLGKRVPTNYNSALAIPSRSLIMGMGSLASTVGGSLRGPDRTVVEMLPEVVVAQRNLDTRVDAYINDESNERTADLFNRVNLNVMRIAALLAVGKNWHLPVIDLECWEWAERFVWHTTSKIESKFLSHGVGLIANENHQLELAVETLQDYIRNGNTKVHEHLRRAKVISYKVLAATLRQRRAFSEDRLGPTIAIRRAITSLLESGELVEVPRKQTLEQFKTEGKMYYINLE